jgi:hypothetical protein
MVMWWRWPGCLDVAPAFFSNVWDEHRTDDTWNAWVCVEEDHGKSKVVGFIVLQVFVHDSAYFAWYPTLSLSPLCLCDECTSPELMGNQGIAAQEARGQARPGVWGLQQHRRDQVFIPTESLCRPAGELGLTWLVVATAASALKDVARCCSMRP